MHYKKPIKTKTTNKWRLNFLVEKVLSSNLYFNDNSMVIKLICYLLNFQNKKKKMKDLLTKNKILWLDKPFRFTYNINNLV